ncbi:mitochondrial intermembrane space import and assembly protein 40-B-like [Lineus longissimus]|uniref:mitochondrial intermembrane space import and assembly protein 40-B-like n=1 Tax=Lineus longissimus TaxID=88925 RepID=UPI002B4F2116
MSYCKKEGKDTVIFATKDDHEKPTEAVLLKEEEEEEPGLIMPNGEINWNCPCLGGMASGPCGVEFREAFSCFHYSTEEMKGADCYEQFSVMQKCMADFPEVYPPKDDDEKDLDFDGLENGQDSEESKSEESSEKMKTSEEKKS